MSWDALVAGLSAAPRVNKVYSYTELDSTNAEAMRLGEMGAPSSSIVIADRQVAGRGRLGRSWIATGDEQLTFSVLWRPDCLAVNVMSITLDVAVSIARAIEEVTNLRPRVKWPNDILVNDRKCCGVLTELKTIGNRVDFVVVGIGVNVTPISPDSPSDIRASAISLSEACGQEVSRNELAFALARHLGNGYERLLDRGGFDRSAWIDYTNSLGRSVRVCEVGGESVEGRTIDVTPSGALVVETSTGQRHTVIAGDVNFV